MNNKDLDFVLYVNCGELGTKADRYFVTLPHTPGHKIPLRIITRVPLTGPDDGLWTLVRREDPQTKVLLSPSELL